MLRSAPIGPPRGVILTKRKLRGKARTTKRRGTHEINTFEMRAVNLRFFVSFSSMTVDLLHLCAAADGSSEWVFTDALGVRAVLTPRCGFGLFATRAFAQGEVVLSDRWLIGMPTESGGSACDHCLRVCSWSPAGEIRCACGARYCSPACQDNAWRQHHQLLCTAKAADSGIVHPLDVFAKHARLAPSVLQQKPEDVLLALRMLATVVLWAPCKSSSSSSGGGSSGGGSSSSGGGSGGGGSSGGGGGGGSSSDTLGGSTTTAATRPSPVPAPFDRLSSYCVLDAVRQEGRCDGCPTDAFRARVQWLGDSFKLISASALGRHVRLIASHMDPDGR